jgi:hypothetical protein
MKSSTLFSIVALATSSYAALGFEEPQATNTWDAAPQGERIIPPLDKSTYAFHLRLFLFH